MFSLVDGFVGRAGASAATGFYFHKDDAARPGRDEVEFYPSGSGVAGEDPVVAGFEIGGGPRFSFPTELLVGKT